MVISIFLCLYNLKCLFYWRVVTEEVLVSSNRTVGLVGMDVLLDACRRPSLHACSGFGRIPTTEFQNAILNIHSPSTRIKSTSTSLNNLRTKQNLSQFEQEKEAG